MRELGEQAQLVLADAHVHIHACFDLGRFFDSAARNFRAEASRRQCADRFTSVLLLTESAGDDWFGALAAGGALSEQAAGGRWRVERTREPDSLRLESSDGSSLLLLAGRQVVTGEDLEVLALATDRKFEDGAPLTETLDQVRTSGAVPVVPWGFGKWWGRRGTLLARVLADRRFAGLFLGDNSARPVLWPRPVHFRLAAERGGRILPGSDPLPFASETWRPGSVGFAFEASIGPDEPARALRAALAREDFDPRPYGARERPDRFLRNQLAMQLRKRRRAL